MAVGGGVVLAASYEAKRQGVRTAMGGRQARALCPGLVVVRPRFDAYLAASHAVFEVFVTLGRAVLHGGNGHAARGLWLVACGLWSSRS